MENAKFNEGRNAVRGLELGEWPVDMDDMEARGDDRLELGVRHDFDSSGADHILCIYR